MQLNVKGKNLEVSDSIRTYAARKLVELELAVEKNPSVSANQVADATVWLKGHTLRARKATRDMKASIDELTEKLLRQVHEERDKRVGKRKIDKHALDAVTFVSLPDGSLLVEDGGDSPLDALAAAVEQEVRSPYRARAVRRGETLWAVEATRIEVVAIPDGPAGDTIDLTQ